MNNKDFKKFLILVVVGLLMLALHLYNKCYAAESQPSAPLCILPAEDMVVSCWSSSKILVSHQIATGERFCCPSSADSFIVPMGALGKYTRDTNAPQRSFEMFAAGVAFGGMR